MPDNRDTEEQHDTGLQMHQPAFAPPRPSPMSSRPQPQAKPTAAEQALQQRFHALRQQMQLQQQGRPNWMRPDPTRSSASIRRVQKALSKDPTLRRILFDMYRSNPSGFLSTDPQQMLRQAQQVANHIRVLAEQHLQAEQQHVDPNDVTHPLNQANPNNLVNQQQAAATAAVIAQDDDLAQNTMVQDQQQQAMEEDADSSYGNNTAAVILLSAEEAQDIAQHNAEHHAPTPEPGTDIDTENEDAKHNHEESETEKLGKHEGERYLAKHADAEEHALISVIDGDKAGFIDAAKGIEKGVEKAAAEVGMRLVAGLA